MHRMKAATYSGIGEIGIQEVDWIKPAPGYVVLDTKQTGICGSDLHSYLGEWDQSDKLAAGHETCGIVAELGAGVTRFKVGDKATAECFSHCGECLYCRKGLYNHCQAKKWISHEAHGGFAEYTILHESGLFKLPDHMSFEDGTLVEPLAVSHRAVARANINARDTLAIIGGGTIGQLCLADAITMGAKETLITVKYDQQTELAKALGANHIVDVRKTNVKEYVKDVTNGLGMDAVIETVGGGQNFDTSMEIVRPRGYVVLVAGYFKPLEVNLSRVVWSEAIVTGSNCYGFSGMETDFEAAIELIDSGEVDAKKLVTHRFPLVQIVEAFKTAADKQSGSIKVHVCQP